MEKETFSHAQQQMLMEADVVGVTCASAGNTHSPHYPPTTALSDYLNPSCSVAPLLHGLLLRCRLSHFICSESPFGQSRRLSRVDIGRGFTNDGDPEFDPLGLRTTVEDDISR